MADPLRDTSDETRTPRWVKVFVVIGGIMVLLVVIMLLAGHRPGDHRSRGDAEVVDTSPSAGGRQ